MAKKTKKAVESPPDEIEVLTPRVAAPAKRSMEEIVAEAVAKALSASLPLVAGVMTQSLVKAQEDQKGADAKVIADAKAHRASGERCQECYQLLPAGCKQGEHAHRMVVVFPQNPRYAKWFMGIKLNGVRYLSNGRNHKICVPADSAIESETEKWERAEDDLRHGRIADHDSGDMHSPRHAHVANWN